MTGNVGVLTGGPEQIEATWKAFSPASIDAMLAVFPPESISAAHAKINDGGWTPLLNAKLAVGFMFGLAALTCAGRIIIRLRTKGRLVLDDCLILFALLNLVGGTVVVYDQVHNLYLEWAATRGDIVVTLMALRNMENFFEMSKWRVAYFFFLWTAIFSVKMAYFAFFRPFLRAMGRAIDYYYWFAVGISVISWILLVMGDAVIVCPHVGKAAIKCAPNMSKTSPRVNAVLWLNAVLDAFTDVLLVTIPIWILRKSTMRTLTKIGLGIFLCLSIFMLVCSIIRATGIRNNAGSNDYPWTTFWLHMEGCIAVTMGSITVYRTTLVGSNDVSDKFRSFMERFYIRTSSDSEKQTSNEGSSNNKTGRFRLKLTGLPGATLTGLRTMFAATATSRSSEQNTNVSFGSSVSSWDDDYHAHITKPSASASQMV